MMKKVKLGSSDVEITPIVFGAWAIGGWMWGGSDDKEAARAIHASMDRGVSSFDTAPVYGFGHSEEIIGRALKDKPRDSYEILSKFGLRWDTTSGDYHFDSALSDGTPVKIHKYSGKKGILEEVDQSLKRLNTDYIDLYQAHWYDSTTPLSEMMEALDILRTQGKIRAAGVCNYNADLMAEAEETAPLASNQIPYSMVERKYEQDVIPYVLRNGNGILAYSPLQRGILTGKITSSYQFQEGDHRPDTIYFKEPNRSAINTFLDGIKHIANAHEASIAQLVINWTVRQPGITAALVGARNPMQVEQNCGALDFVLADSELTSINQALSQLEIVRKFP